MTISRRDALTRLGSAGVGAAVAIGVDRTIDALSQNTPLPIYNSSVSALVPDRSRPTAAAARVTWFADTTARRLALTFDDGPHPEWTPRVLDTLSQTRTPATFFVIGDQVRQYPSVHARSANHELGNHTQTHPDLGRYALAQCADEIGQCQQTVRDVLGREPALFRPPYGHFGGATVLACAQASLSLVLWSAQAKEDRAADRPDGIVDQLAGDAHPGAVVLMHDSGSSDRLLTIDRLGQIVRRLTDEGWQFATVSTLLAGD